MKSLVVLLIVLALNYKATAQPQQVDDDEGAEQNAQGEGKQGKVKSLPVSFKISPERIQQMHLSQQKKDQAKAILQEQTAAQPVEAGEEENPPIPAPVKVKENVRLSLELKQIREAREHQPLGAPAPVAIDMDEGEIEDDTLFPQFDQLETKLGDDDDYTQLRWKHERLIPDVERSNTDPTVTNEIINTVANYELEFIGYDQSYNSFVPKYIRRKPLQPQPMNFITIGMISEPKVSKHAVMNIYLMLEVKDKIAYAVLPFKYENGKDVENVRIMKRNGEFYFDSPYKCSDTKQPYRSFFFEAADIDENRKGIVYTWMLFLDEQSNVSFVIQVLVMNAGTFRDIRRDSEVDAISEDEKYSHVLVPNNNYKFIQIHPIYNLPMYRNNDDVDPSDDKNVLSLTERNKPPLVNNAIVTKLWVEIIEDFENEVEFQFALLPIYEFVTTAPLLYEPVGTITQMETQETASTTLGYAAGTSRQMEVEPGSGTRTSSSVNPPLVSEPGTSQASSQMEVSETESTTLGTAAGTSSQMEVESGSTTRKRQSRWDVKEVPRTRRQVEQSESGSRTRKRPSRWGESSKSAIVTTATMKHKIRVKIGVRNDFVAFFTIPFAPSPTQTEATQKQCDMYTAEMFADKYGRHYVWLPFKDNETKQEYFMQIRVFRSRKFMLQLINEYNFVKHGYFEQPEGVQVVEEIKTAYPNPEDPRDLRDLFIDIQYYILAVSYIPIGCALQVHKNIYIRKTACVSPNWNIHGVWGNDKSKTKRQKAICNSGVNRGDPNAYVRDLNQIPAEYPEISVPISANFNNSLKWFDYQWCVHGYFLSSNGQRAFATHGDYFRFAFNAYSDLNLKNKLEAANLTPSDNEIYEVESFNLFISSLPCKPEVRTLKFFGNVIVVREILFCYDLARNMVNCTADIVPQFDEKNLEQPNVVFFPTKHVLFPHILLQLRIHKHYNKVKLLISTMRSSNYNFALVRSSHRNRMQHITAMKVQLYKDPAIPHFLEEKKNAWFTKRVNQQIKLDWHERKIESAVQLMNEVTQIITLLDYFKIAVEMFEKVEANMLVDEQASNLVDFYTKDHFTNRMKFFTGMEEIPEYVLFCNNDIFAEIRLCFSTDTLDWIPCTALDTVTRFDEAVTVCPTYFKFQFEF
ncbi:hypothetical protein B4U80_13072 [Leptotrombidium deliense]|uniref:Uncharacterized protein n=1 Tax=Leptotrombidium deliense TaxID=299467 RepID=A0A443SD98_9ACAR|nr:hypothetical protein B4U80_13072 [Leptotrombidium deliense]